MIDAGAIIDGIPAVKTSFVLPLVCFVVIAIYGYRAQFVYKI
jgi:FHS family L-fucose permease-like MFS transporter